MTRKITQRIIINILLWANLGVLLIAVGCAAKSAKMVPKCFDIVNKHPYIVSVNESTGGIEAKPLWVSQISNYVFTKALNDSLLKSGVFQGTITGGGVDSAGGADYILDVTILDYDQPWHGANIIINIETKWELTDARTHKSIWYNTFKTGYRAQWLESIFDGERIEKAQESAAQANIMEGIRRLSLLSL